MMIIDNVCLLASNTVRSKAYIQRVIDEDILPGHCVVYTDDVNAVEKEVGEYIRKEKETLYFDKDKPILLLLKDSGISYEIFGCKDINNPTFIEKIKNLPMEYMIYSGYGGYILKKPLFELGKKYIHVHAGMLPQYRGSTTAYYSMLEKDYIGASAIFLNEKIDEGKIIASEKFELPKDRPDIDLVYEPYLRSVVLVKALKIYIDIGSFPETIQDSADARTYFVIHPVLKHLAIMKYYEI